MSPELPASALYSHPSLARLWKKVHLACSPFILRPTAAQVAAWIYTTRLRTIARWIETRGEEGLWLVSLRSPSDKTKVTPWL